jgi:hypothetical protein
MVYDFIVVKDLVTINNKPQTVYRIIITFLTAVSEASSAAMKII